MDDGAFGAAWLPPLGREFRRRSRNEAPHTAGRHHELAFESNFLTNDRPFVHGLRLPVLRFLDDRESEFIANYLAIGNLRLSHPYRYGASQFRSIHFEVESRHLASTHP